MRTEWFVGFLALATLVGCTDESAENEMEDGSTDAETLTARTPTWEVRLDQEDADEGGFQLLESEEGLRLETGPAGVFYDPADLVGSGDYTLSATFIERGDPGSHRESYGLFVGGRDLQSPEVTYTYFLVRSTGEYLIKRREGEETRDLVGWTSDPAVRSAEEGSGSAGEGADGTAAAGDTSAAGAAADAAGGSGVTNTLTIRTRGDAVTFLVNGTEVESLPAERVRPWGLVGMRANHRLSLDIRDWSITSAGSQGPGGGPDGGDGAQPDTGSDEDPGT